MAANSAEIKPRAGDDRFIHHARVFAALTLLSRLLGLVRDALLVRILGVTGIGTAFNIAFQFPNTFRRLFGEGALAAAFIPEYAQTKKHDPERAARLASLSVALLGAGLTVVAGVIGLALSLVLALVPMPQGGQDAVLLLVIMLPFMPLVCITALLGAMLQTHGRFAAQAGAPVILNLCMIGATVIAGYALRAEPRTTAIVVAASVTLAGLLQVAWCLRDLRGLAGWTRAVQGIGDSVRRVAARMGPVALGLGAMQIGTLIESWVLVGWPLYIGPTIGGAAYPLDDGAGAALYNAQRLYQFPLGIFGIALATAVFPLLARQSDEPQQFASTLRRGLRMSALIGIPATAGLIWVADDLVAVVFQGGAVGPIGAARISRCLVAYGLLVGTYSLIHVLTRAFYARGETKLPMRVSIVTVALGLVLSAGLMWPLREPGLAAAASIASIVQLLALAHFAHRRLGEPGSLLFDRATAMALARIAGATTVMLAVLWLLSLILPLGEGRPWWGRLALLVTQCGVGAATFGVIAFFVSPQEVRWILEKGPQTPVDAALDDSAAEGPN